LDAVVGVAECEGGVRVVGVELIDERSQPLVEEPHHPVHLVNALSLLWGQAGGPQPGDAAQRAHTGQQKLSQPDAVQSLMKEETSISQSVCVRQHTPRSAAN
jgi:hypothetical protein